jgi:hypothetical protein
MVRFLFPQSITLHHETISISYLFDLHDHCIRTDKLDDDE